MIDAKTDMTLVVAAYEHHQYRPMGAPGEVRIHGIFASQYTLPDGSVAGDFQWLADQYKADPHTRRLDALVTLESVQAAVAELLLECEGEVERANENAILLERAADRILALESALRLCVAALDPQHAGRIARAALGETK